MSNVSPAAQLEVIQELIELGLLKLEDFEKFFGIGTIKLGEPLPDFNDGEEEVDY